MKKPCIKERITVYAKDEWSYARESTLYNFAHITSANQVLEDFEGGGECGKDMANVARIVLSRLTHQIRDSLAHPPVLNLRYLKNEVPWFKKEKPNRRLRREE